mmetsp:Transcript_5472/g.12700  ORF Transcript_5472/g.12700 Transcript_5472/m.12700 type:complete len:224 (+) Transcript_5472:1479-2150(+)
MPPRPHGSKQSSRPPPTPSRRGAPPPPPPPQRALLRWVRAPRPCSRSRCPPRRRSPRWPAPRSRCPPPCPSPSSASTLARRALRSSPPYCRWSARSPPSPSSRASRTSSAAAAGSACTRCSPCWAYWPRSPWVPSCSLTRRSSAAATWSARRSLTRASSPCTPARAPSAPSTPCGGRGSGAHGVPARATTCAPMRRRACAIAAEGATSWSRVRWTRRRGRRRC